ncbi:MAG: hypothetical protein M0T74_03360 [Desulfitobacterium hafniense]|nr:hypothetical protein [Desulfitobacterium hafniense]
MLWLVFGLVLGFVFYWLLAGVKSGKRVIKVYQWVLGIISVSLLLFTIQNVLGFQRELEPSAAWFMVVSTGIPAIIIGAFIWIIPFIKNRQSGKANSQSTVSIK